jgi:hypothetical protein
MIVFNAGAACKQQVDQHRQISQKDQKKEIASFSL